MTNITASQLFKTSFLSALILLSAFVSFAQDKTLLSPPASTTGKIGKANVTINYSSPAVKGRTIGKEIAPYGGIVWRTGANKATTIAFTTDVMIEGQPLKAGTYSLFTIPNPKEWVIIFNKVADQFGAFTYKQDEDALRVKVKPTTSADMYERFKIDLKAKGKKDGVITLLWGNIAVPVKVKA